MPEIRSLLQRAISLLESQEDRVRRILNSSFLNLSDSYSLTFNSSAYLLNRWVTHHPGWWSDATHGETTEIDILIAKVAGSPLDAGRLIDSTSFLAPLIYGCNDTEVVRKLWLSATDPRMTSVTTAGQRITRLVEEVFGDQEWREGIAPTWVDIHKQLTTRRKSMTCLAKSWLLGNCNSQASHPSGAGPPKPEFTTSRRSLMQRMPQWPSPKVLDLLSIETSLIFPMTAVLDSIGLTQSRLRLALQQNCYATPKFDRPTWTPTTYRPCSRFPRFCHSNCPGRRHF